MPSLFNVYCASECFLRFYCQMGSKYWGWLGFYVSGSKTSFFIHEGCEKNVFFDKSYSCSAVGVMKSMARECNSIQDSSIPLCLKCRQTLASSLKGNYNKTSRDLQCYLYLSALLYFQCVVLSCIFISATDFMHFQVKCRWIFSRMKPVVINLYVTGLFSYCWV